MEDMIMEHHKFTESKDPLVDAMRKAATDSEPFGGDLPLHLCGLQLLPAGIIRGLEVHLPL